MVQDKLLKLHREGETLKNELRQQTLGFLLAAFGLVAGLAWNEAVKSLIESVFPAAGNSVTAKFIYAILITIAVVFATFYLSRLVSKDKKES